MQLFRQAQMQLSYSAHATSSEGRVEPPLCDAANKLTLQGPFVAARVLNLSIRAVQNGDYPALTHNMNCRSIH